MDTKNNLLTEAETLITATVHKWGHNDICDCKRCQWLRRAVKVVDEIPIGKDTEAEYEEVETIAERLRIHEEQKAKERAADSCSVVCPFCNGKFRIDSEGVIIQ